MPGVASLQAHQYYALPRNAFWPIMARLAGHGLLVDYSQRVALLGQTHIALWDVIAFCQREGSLDTAIKQPLPNDFDAFFTKHQQIQAIAFNGQAAHKLYRKLVSTTVTLPQLVLPSTSPAAARLSFEQKLEKWAAILPYIA